MLIQFYVVARLQIFAKPLINMNFTSKLWLLNKRTASLLQRSIPTTQNSSSSIFPFFSQQRSFHPTNATQRKRKEAVPPYLDTEFGFSQVVKELEMVRKKLNLPDDRMPHYTQLLKHASAGNGSRLVNAIKEHHNGFGMVAIKMNWLTRQQAKTARKREANGQRPLTKEEMLAAQSHNMNIDASTGFRSPSKQTNINNKQQK